MTLSMRYMCVFIN